MPCSSGPNGLRHSHLGYSVQQVPCRVGRGFSQRSECPTSIHQSGKKAHGTFPLPNPTRLLKSLAWAPSQPEAWFWEWVYALSSWDFPTLCNNQCCGNLIVWVLPTSWSCPDDTFLGIIRSNRGLGTRGVQGPALEDMFHSPGREVPGAMLRRT